MHWGEGLGLAHGGLRALSLQYPVPCLLHSQHDIGLSPLQQEASNLE